MWIVYDEWCHKLQFENIQIRTLNHNVVFYESTRQCECLSIKNQFVIKTKTYYWGRYMYDVRLININYSLSFTHLQQPWQICMPHQRHLVVWGVSVWVWALSATYSEFLLDKSSRVPRIQSILFDWIEGKMNDELTDWLSRLNGWLTNSVSPR